jgi:large repetitive protein
MKSLACVVLSFLFATAALAQSSDVAVSKTGPGTTTADADVAYDVFVTNVGPDDAGVVTLTDDVPAGMTFVSAVQNSGTPFLCSTPAGGGTGTISCTAPAMLAGATADFTFTFHTDPASTPGTTFLNTANVSTANDPNDENNSSVAGTLIPPNDADIAVTKTGPSSAGPNTDVTYTITVANGGPNAGQTVVMTDTLPGDMTFVSLGQSGATFSCTTPAAGSGGTISCTAGTLAAGASTTFTLVGHIPNTASAGATYVNTASVTSKNDPNDENNSQQTELTVSSADLSVVKSGPAAATAGQTISYTITLTNNGPNAAENAAFTDTLPGGTTFNSLVHTSGVTLLCQTPPSGASGTVFCQTDALGASGSATYTLTLNISAAFLDGATLTNTATASTTSYDPNANNDSSSSSAIVAGLTDISVTKTAPASANAGSNISYTITVTNNGPNAAANTQLSDTLPAGTTFVSLTQNSGPAFNCTTGATINCTNGSFASGASATFTLVAKTASSATGSISNTATVSTTTQQTNNSNDTSVATTTLTQSADLAVTKTGPAVAAQNQTVNYTITVTNNGPSDAANVTLTDNVPPQATFVSMTQQSGQPFACSGTTSVTCTTGLFGAGISATFQLTVQTNASVTGGMINTANVSSSTSDPNTANNSASAATNLATADLAVTKSAAPATVAAGGNITWTIGVTNNGPNDATNVTLSDTLPANTTFVSLNQTSGPTFNCTTGATVTCTIATLTAGTSASFTLVAQTSPSTPAGTISNTATVTAASPFDPTPGNNTATSNTTVALVDLSLTKSGSASPVVAGSVTTFTLTVMNSGSVAASGVVITDPLPAGFTFTGNSTPSGACSGTTTVTCNAGTLAAGASATFTIDVNVPQVVGNQTNTATVTSANGDSNPANNTGAATINVIPGAAIPTLSPLLLGLLAAMLAFVALRRT